jgi:hypothetical protein
MRRCVSRSVRSLDRRKCLQFKKKLCTTRSVRGFPNFFHVRMCIGAFIKTSHPLTNPRNLLKCKKKRREKL